MDVISQKIQRFCEICAVVRGEEDFKGITVVEFTDFFGPDPDEIFDFIKNVENYQVTELFLDLSSQEDDMIRIKVTYSTPKP